MFASEVFMLTLRPSTLISTCSVNADERFGEGREGGVLRGRSVGKDNSKTVVETLWKRQK